MNNNIIYYLDLHLWIKIFNRIKLELIKNKIHSITWRTIAPQRYSLWFNKPKRFVWLISCYVIENPCFKSLFESMKELHKDQLTFSLCSRQHNFPMQVFWVEEFLPTFFQFLAWVKIKVVICRNSLLQLHSFNLLVLWE